MSRPLLLTALIVWALSAFGHGVGLELAGSIFSWARQPGTWLSAEGGGVGMARLELLMGLGFASVALGVVARLLWLIVPLRPTRAQLLSEAVPWLTWALATYLIWKVYIVYATELTHFAQYALVGFLVALAWKRGRDPQLAFLIAAGLGLLDEIWQHYLLPRPHEHVMQHWMDWSDLVLDALGAVGGILPFVTLARLRGEALPDTLPRLKAVFAGVACVLLPILLLNPVVQSTLLGHYRYGSFWFEYENDKPVHWPGPADGVPLVLAALLILGLLVEPRRRSLGQGGVAVLLALLVVAVQPPSREAGQPVHEVVPVTVARRTPTRIVVDGTLEPAWERAQRIGPFVKNGDGSPAALGATYARVLWDDERIYFAFEVDDDDVWARDLDRDDADLPADEVVEVFLDDGGDETTYFELEVSPKNVVQDLFCFLPRAPVDFDPGYGFQAMNAWDARGLETAAQVKGRLDVVKRFRSRDLVHGGDQGWVVEIALPWRAIAPYPTGGVAHRPTPPRAGDRWRLGLYRIERPRVPADALDESLTLRRDEAEALFASLEGGAAALQRALDGKMIIPDAEGLLPRWRVLQVHAQARAEYQAWAPTHRASFHVPSWFGVLAFGE